MLKACAYQSAFACFHFVPHCGVPGGSGRLAIGRPLVTLAQMYPPPRKPRPLWSKLSLLNSSIMVCEAPVARNGLIQRSLKNTLMPDLSGGRNSCRPRPAGRRVVGRADAAISSSFVLVIVKAESTTTSAGCSIFIAGHEVEVAHAGRALGLAS